jgi:hypothetical protein
MKRKIKIPTWSKLAKIQQIKTVRSTYVWLFLVPLAAKALAKVESAANVTIFDYSFALQMRLPFSWKIFYFSALSFSLANLVVLWRCYTLFKDHRSFSDFVNEGKNHWHLAKYAKEANLGLDDIGYEGHDMVLDKDDNFKRSFWTLFEQLNSARTASRGACALLYVIGFLLISIILFQNLLAVLKFMF